MPVSNKSCAVVRIDWYVPKTKRLDFAFCAPLVMGNDPTGHKFWMALCTVSLRAIKCGTVTHDGVWNVGYRY